MEAGGAINNESKIVGHQRASNQFEQHADILSTVDNAYLVKRSILCFTALVHLELALNTALVYVLPLRKLHQQSSTTAKVSMITVCILK